jgi:hypothetical protein
MNTSAAGTVDQLDMIKTFDDELEHALDNSLSHMFNNRAHDFR